MFKTLPLGAIIAQKKTRSNRQLKELLFVTLKELSSLTPKQKVNYVREKVDFYLSYANTEKVSCYKGCSHCCHHLIHLSKDEAQSLPNLHEKQKHRLNDQTTHLEEGKDWSDLDKPKRACVYLDDANSCSVYEKRPLVCRITHVTSPNDNCDLETDLDIEPLFEDKANTIVLAYYTLEENHSMPKLLKELK